MRSMYLVLLCLFASSAWLLGIEDPDRVVTHVRFLNPEGLFISDIELEEVRLLEDGLEQEIIEFYPMNDPFRVGVIWDISPSMQPDLELIRYDVREFLLNLPSRYPVLLITFDSEIYVDSDWTMDREALDQAASWVGKYEGKSKAALFEAVTLAVKQKFDFESPRTAALILADGHDSGSDGVSEEDTLLAVHNKQVLIYSLQYDTREHYRFLFSTARGPMWDPPAGTTGRDMGGIFAGGGQPSNRDQSEYKVQSGYRKATEVMRELAQTGKGRHFEIQNPTQLAEILQNVEKELATCYTLVHRRTPEQTKTGYRRVQVMCSRSGIRGVQINSNPQKVIGSR